jgi:antitoxin ParD1/3/4
MAQELKISVALNPEMQALVQAAIESGEYANGSDVIVAALHEWQLRRTLREQEHAELRQLWTEGLASGPGSLGDMEAIKHEARRRQAAPSQASD